MQRRNLLAIAVAALLTPAALYAQCNHAAQPAAGGCCSKPTAPAGGSACSKPAAPAAGAHAGCAHHEPAARALPKPIETIFEQYIGVQSALAKDSLEALREPGSALIKAFRASGSAELSRYASTVEGILSAPDLDAARKSFATLSRQLTDYAAVVGISKYPVFYCGMAKAVWLQKDTELRNPYMGAKMLGCGERRS